MQGERGLKSKQLSRLPMSIVSEKRRDENGDGGRPIAGWMDGRGGPRSRERGPDAQRGERGVQRRRRRAVSGHFA